MFAAVALLVMFIAAGVAFRRRRSSEEAPAGPSPHGTRADMRPGDLLEPGRIYQVEPTDPFENDPNLTDTKFPGNPTRSNHTTAPLRAVGEVADWEGRTAGVLQGMLDHLAKFEQRGFEAIND